MKKLIRIFLDFQDTVLPEAVNYWSKALRVRRTENTIRLSRKCQHNQVFFKVNCQKTPISHTICKDVQ